MPGILGPDENWKHLILWEKLQKVPHSASFSCKQEQLQCPAYTLSYFFCGFSDEQAGSLELWGRKVVYFSVC